MKLTPGSRTEELHTDAPSCFSDSIEDGPKIFGEVNGQVQQGIYSLSSLRSDAYEVAVNERQTGDRLKNVNDASSEIHAMS